jgi:flagellar biosynthesis/type III secretory pathway protein FliH
MKDEYSVTLTIEEDFQEALKKGMEEGLQRGYTSLGKRLVSSFVIHNVLRLQLFREGDQFKYGNL